MKKSEFKEVIFRNLDADLDNCTFEEKMLFTERLLIEYQKNNEAQRDKANHGKPWTEDDLRIILQDAPTVANCLKYAKLFKRGYGSIEQIYRWAATSDKEVERKRPEDSFIAQIKKIAKEVGWRAS